MNETTTGRLARQLDGLYGVELIDGLFAFLRERGDRHYDEVVTQLEHALQCAELARQRGLSPDAITAALFHDLGHLFVDERDGETQLLAQGEHHGTTGAAFLARWFPPAVTEPIRMHVIAKRYLCAIEPEYLAGLSPASVRSLHWQGGPLADDEVRTLADHPDLPSALEIRRIDDTGKQPQWQAPELETFRATVASCLRAEFADDR